MKKSVRGGGSHSKSKFTGSYKNVYFAGFDTEDDSEGYPYLFCCVHERGSFWCDNSDEFLQKILRLRESLPGDSVMQLWATNLEYDLVNLFGTKRIREVQLRFGRNYLVSARWKKIEFRDTIRHIQSSVKQLGELIGIEKHERPKNFAVPKSERQWTIAIRYCMRDARISYRVARELDSIYTGIGVRTRTTLASTAYHLWEEKYFGEKLRHAPDEIREAGKNAYFGGRTEPFAIGDFKNVVVADIASMYPWAMVADSFPVLWGPIRQFANQILVAGRKRKYKFVAFAKIESSYSPGLLPYRHKNFSTSYPIGVFSGWYIGEELEYAASCGARVEIVEGYEFLETIRPFDGYVADLFSRKNAARGTLKLVYKLLLNSLYGKFGSQGSRITATPLEEWEENGRPHEWDCRVWNGLVIYRCDAPPPPWGNMIWAAIVTARARIKLHKEIVRLNESGAKVLYCDTDSVFFIPSDKKNIRYPKTATNAGDWELKGIYKSLYVAGKKEYILEEMDGTNHVHAKGIPYEARENYIRQGHAEFKRPTRLLESTRTGIGANIWSKRTKTRHVHFNNRIRNRDGFLSPILVRGGEIVNPDKKGVRENGKAKSSKGIA